MKNNILQLISTVLFSVFLFSCEEEDLINGGSKNTTTGTATPVTGTTPTTTTPTTGTTPTTTTPAATKCYIKEISSVENGVTSKEVYTFNAKNLLEKVDNDGAISTYTYDANNRVSKLAMVDGAATETFAYTYDSKGNITNVKYTAKNTPIDLLITEYNFTTNATGQVTKVVAVSKDGNLDFSLEYDTKNNLKKLSVNANGVKNTLIDNLTFDDKINTYQNAELSKIHIPLVVIGAFFGKNLSYFINTNNILSDKATGLFGDSATIYSYSYTKEGQPAKINYTRTEGKDQIKGSSTYTYVCK